MIINDYHNILLENGIKENGSKKNCPLNKNDRGTVIQALYSKGHSPINISNLLNLSEGTVDLYLDGKTEPPRGSGRAATSPEKCAIPKCNNTFGGESHGGRGLCKRCHQRANSLVRKGTTTWKELEELGLAKPKYSTIVEEALINARKERDVHNPSGDRAGTIHNNT